MIHNQTIDNPLNHLTIRAFKDQSLTADQLQPLYAAASHTSTSMFMQQFSILHLTDPQLRQAVREQAIPFRVGNPLPNLETLRSIEDARKGNGLSRGFSSVAGVMEDLNAGD